MSDHGMSERKACKTSGLARSTLRYQTLPRDGCRVINFIQSHLAVNPRRCFDPLYATDRFQKQP
ncbi:hypothetical protein [Hydrogenophaga crassostreae]|nr:hypothetical protein [Hydrogenophaga crassostreae]AOW12033.1 hypothetical protein LPB072_03375 [Hydrogenophaga crassostreae]